MLNDISTVVSIKLEKVAVSSALLREVACHASSAQLLLRVA